MAVNTGVDTKYPGPPVNSGQAVNITAQTAGTQIRTGAGVLHTLTFNKPVATAVVTLYDGTSTSGKVLGTITTPASPQPCTLTYDAYFDTGLFVVLATADEDITIVTH
ncbi:MAG: hypothetical protein KGI66_04295 [Patescibacteria group bacterium]|nr:hypothetical protein [Patescibacteria group bacterium]